MDITKRLIELDKIFELHNEGDWKNPYDSNKAGYSSFNDAGIEVETGEFLYAFVRMLKPDHALETGTHWGVGAAYMGSALKENKKGRFETIEFLPEIYHKAKERIQRLGLSDYVECLFGDVANFQVAEGVKYKLVLLDTEPQTRFAELIKFFPHVEPGGFIFIHDLHQHMHQIGETEHGPNWPYGTLPEAIKELVRTDKLRPFHFETPRGLTGFYKTHPQDYNWNK